MADGQALLHLWIHHLQVRQPTLTCLRRQWRGCGHKAGSGAEEVLMGMAVGTERVAYTAPLKNSPP